MAIIPTVLLRHGLPVDVPRLMEIRALVRENRLVNPGRVTREDYDWFLEHGVSWVAEGRQGLVLGFAMGDPRDGSVWALFVDPDEEGQGMGRRLLERVCLGLQARGHSRLTLTTAPGTRAERLYRAAGWSDVGHTASGELIFTKLLEGAAEEPPTVEG
jgi:GNAT superfamily N-acetyltransferase